MWRARLEMLSSSLVTRLMLAQVATGVVWAAAAAGLVWCAMLQDLAISGLLVVVALPLLVLVAWGATRLALRPWQRLSDEIGSRGPHDLAPLQQGAGYNEMRAFRDAFNLLLQRMDGSLSREGSFIADAAHELRTPLAAMRINVEALKVHRQDARDTELLDGLVRSGERASRLVSQLLGLMRSETDRTAKTLASISLDLLVQDRLAALSSLAMQREVELELAAEDDCTVKGEAEGLVSLVDNLVENAIKYSPAGAKVEVRVARLQAGVTLTVEDAGSGIPAAFRGRVFDRFFRVPDQSVPGSGLGLAIVKTVAVRHGANIELGAGRRGIGLRVQVSFPPPATDEAVAATSAPGARREAAQPVPAGYSSFDSATRLASGSLESVALRARSAFAAGAAGPVLIFDDATGQVVDLNLQGSDVDVQSRVARCLAGTTGVAATDGARERAGAITREVKLLPRHWEWLASQPGGDSAELRKLVEAARKAPDTSTQRRKAHERAYRFMSVLAGDWPGYEEATRALFADDAPQLVKLMSDWPKDVREHVIRLHRGSDGPNPVSAVDTVRVS